MLGVLPIILFEDKLDLRGKINPDWRFINTLVERNSRNELLSLNILRIQTKRIFEIALIIASLFSWFFSWLLVRAWMLSLLETVQGQLDEVVGYRFEGMIVYLFQIIKP